MITQAERKEKKRKEKKRKEKKRKEKKRKEKKKTTPPFGVNLMRSQVLYQAAQVRSPVSYQAAEGSGTLERISECCALHRKWIWWTWVERQVFLFLCFWERSVRIPAKTEGTGLKATTCQQHAEADGKGIG